MTHVVLKEMRLTKQLAHFLISLLLLISTLWGPGLGVYLQRPNMAIWWDVNFGILSHLASFYCRKAQIHVHTGIRRLQDGTRSCAKPRPAQLVFRVTLVSVNSDSTTQSGVQNASK